MSTELYNQTVRAISMVPRFRTIENPDYAELANAPFEAWEVVMPTASLEMYDGRDPLFELWVAVDMETYFSREPETDGRDGTEGYELEDLV